MDRTNVTDKGYTYGGVDYQYQTRTDGNGNPYQVAIPSSAPKGQTSTSSPTASPTAVVSSSSALNDLNTRVIPAYNQIQSSVSTFNSNNTPGNRPGDSVYSPTDPKNPVIGPNNGLLGYRGYDGNTYQTKDEALSKKYQGGDGKYYATTDEATANTPQPGNYYAYNPSGQRIEIPVGQTAPTGFTTTPNANGAPTSSALETVNDSAGGSIRKMADGTFAQYDNNGQFVGKTNELVYNNLKQSNDLAQKLSDMANGSFTLSDNEKAQIANIKAIYQKNISDTQTLYGNLAGSQSILQNLYGMGNTITGQGEITGIVQKGIQAVTDLTTQMESKVAEMTDAFKTKDMAALKTAYETFNKYETARQDALTKMKDDITLAGREREQQQATANTQTDDDIRGLIQTATQNGAKPEQIQKMQAALQTHNYSAAAEAGGDSLLTASGVAGEYYTYARDERSRGTPESKIMSFNQYQQADANRKAKIAAAGVANGYSQQTMTKVLNVADDFKNEPQVKAYQVVAEGKQFMDSIANNTSNPADQQGIIYAFAKIMDPNSVVREGEYATVQKYAQSWADQFGFKVDRIYSNAPFLTPQAIANMKKTVASRVSASEKAYNNIYTQKVGTINKITGGADGGDYITDYSKPFKTIGGEHNESHSQAEGMSNEDLTKSMSGGGKAKSNSSFFDGL